MRTTLLCLTTAFTFAAMAQVPSYVPTSGLVAWYPLNNSAVDVGPYGLNGTVNGTSATDNRLGDPGEASAFDGFAYDQIPSSPLFNASLAMTVSAWVNLNDATVNQKVLGRTNDSFNTGYILGVENGRLHPEVWNIEGTAHSFSAGTITSGTWTHVAITWGSNYYMVAYVNGVAEDSLATEMAPIGSNSEPLIIGGSPWSTSPLYFPVTGSIDDIGIWDRALSPDEIMDVYNSGSTGIAHLDLNSDLAVYPNPASSSVSITSTPEMAGQHYQVIDAMGRMVAQGKLDYASTQVSIEALASGIYSVQIGDAQSKVLKLVKQ